MASARQRKFTDLAVTDLAEQGDGVATVDGKRIYVPFTAPGDRIDAVATGTGHARATAWRAHGPGRQEPACPHFGRCGGCAVQHLDPALYRSWKIARIESALGRFGIQTPVIAPLAETPPGARRRAAFAARRRGTEVRLGFNERASHAIVTVERCPVLRPELVALLPKLRMLLAEILPDGGATDAVATATDSGIDLLLAGIAAGTLAQRERLAAFAAALDLARIAVAGGRGEPDVLAARRPPRVMFDDVTVELPPGGFLQASVEGERAIRDAVRAAIGGAGAIADLYAGCGTLSLPLARGARVHAVEGARALAGALDAAARRAGLAPRVTVEIRDLARRPLRVDELKRFDAVVFDPPRDGAAAQAASLALSRVPTVVGVSCNPTTFARDAELLIAGGYRLTHVAPIDQFLWSPHVELVGTFART